MNIEHVVDPAVNYVPVYSIEYRPTHNPFEGYFPMAWAQHGRTQSKFMARILAMETAMRYRKGYERRVRVL